MFVCTCIAIPKRVLYSIKIINNKTNFVAYNFKMCIWAHANFKDYFYFESLKSSILKSPYLKLIYNFILMLQLVFITAHIFWNFENF